MADDALDFGEAKKLAQRLRSVPGFPWDEENIAATAEDLVCWCRGSITGGKAWSAYDQAVWLIDSVRLCWTEKWLGPGMMLKVFRGKFELEKLGPERQVWDTAELERTYGKPDPGWASRLPKSQPLNDSRDRWKRVHKLMGDRAFSQYDGKTVSRLGQVDQMRVQIWAQEQVGIEVTPEQRRFVE